MNKLLRAFLALLVALLGVGGAWAYFTFNATVSIAIAVVGILVGLLGFVSYLLGRSMLPNQPVRAVQFMELWILGPVVLAALGGAFIIFLGVRLSPGEDASTQTEKLLAATFAAISGFLTTVLIDSVVKAEGSLVGEPIKKAFHAAYKEDERLDGDEQRWVYGEDYRGVSGWGFTARRQRAKGVQAALSKAAK